MTLRGPGGVVMAANKSQGSFYTLFLAAATVLCAGVFGLLASLFGMLKIKPLEGRTALKPSSTAMKLIGAFVAAFGWFITLFGMHLTISVAGRMILALVGIGVTLFGIIVILPAAFNKNAVWET